MICSGKVDFKEAFFPVSYLEWFSWNVLNVWRSLKKRLRVPNFCRKMLKSTKVDPLSVQKKKILVRLWLSWTYDTEWVESGSNGFVDSGILCL